jgi:hypothetical protein
MVMVAYYSFSKFRHKLPTFMAAVTITINIMDMVASGGDTFSTVAIKIDSYPYENHVLVMVTVTVDRWRRSNGRWRLINTVLTVMGA